MAKPYPCFVCSPKPAPSKSRRLSPAALAVALQGQQPKASRSVILPPSRFKRFWGRTNTARFMSQPPRTFTRTLAPGQIGTGRVAPCPMQP